MKKIFCGFVFILGILGAMYAEGFTYYHKDYGWTTVRIEYLGTSKDFEISICRDAIMSSMQKNGYQVGKIKKISNFLSWAAWSALREYDIYDGEVYDIMISNSNNLSVIYRILVEICDNGKAFHWSGFYVQLKF